MTGDGAGQPDSRGQAAGWWRRVVNHLEWFNRYPAVKTAVVVAELVGLSAVVVSCVSAVLSNSTGDAEPPVKPTTSINTTVPTPVNETGPTTTATTPSSVLQRCWTSAKAAVDCRDAHQFEELPGSPACTAAALLRYLGGVANLDVSIARPARTTGGGCSIDARRAVMGSARDVLRSTSHAAWRRCVDRRVQQEVPCSALHSGELIATGSLRRATGDECIDAAFRYMDQLPGNVTEDLIVLPLDVSSKTADSARCTIEARGNHLLNDSVRNLGAAPVPIDAR